MKLIHVLSAAAIALPLFAASAGAQVQLNVCGAPPLPPCRPQVEERVIIERERPRGRVIEERRVERLGDVCRTRSLRCRVDEPRPVGARCTCENEDGDEVIGRIR